MENKLKEILDKEKILRLSDPRVIKEWKKMFGFLPYGLDPIRNPKIKDLYWVKEES